MAVNILSALVQAIETVFSWPIFGFLFLGLLIGIIVGAIPGIGASLGMAILLPLTLPLDGITALIFLVCIYLGGTYGGSISAILLNVPGTSAAAATTLDGYPMARKGKARNALASSAVSSAVGGIISTFIILITTPFLVQFVLLFGTPQYFLLAILGLVMITVVAQGSLIKGLIAGSLGLFSTTVGVAPISFQSRYTFGIIPLQNGFDFVAALLALFAIAEMISLSRTTETTISEVAVEGSIREGIIDTLEKPISLIKASIIGLFIGTIPGSGASISNFVSYAEAMRNSDKNFGSGVLEGVLASEASNNSTVPGSLIPTLSFGIPGSGSSAVLLGALILHGLVPGPDLFSSQLSLTYSLFLSLFVGSILIGIIGLLVITRASYFTKIDVNLIIPLIVILAVLGGFALNSNWADVYYLIILGVGGYFMKRYNFSVIAYVLGAILGPIAEENLWRSLQISGGSWEIFVSSWLSLLLVILIVLILFLPFIDEIRTGSE